MPKQKNSRNYAVFILTHRRPERVLTYHTLRRYKYTGPIFLVVDSLDPKLEEYKQKFKDEVIVFDKRDVAKLFDAGDNFANLRGVVYARNANFEIAKKLGYEYFIQLDDDYKEFRFRFNHRLEYGHFNDECKCLDKVFDALLKFFISSNANSLAIAQGGDFIGGPSRGTHRRFFSFVSV